MPRGGKRKGAGAPKKAVTLSSAITIRITPELKIKLKSKAQKLNLSQNQYLLELIKKDLDRI